MTWISWLFPTYFLKTLEIIIPIEEDFYLQQHDDDDDDEAVQLTSLNFAVAGSRLTEEEENLAGRAEQLPDVIHTEFHS
jgi:hypothetical protein